MEVKGKFLGTIFETISTTKYKFTTKPGGILTRGSLVTVFDKKENVNYLGRIVDVKRENYFIDSDSAVQLSRMFEKEEKLDVDSLGLKGSFSDHIVATMEIIGYRPKNSSYFIAPNIPLEIGTKVYEAKEDFILSQLGEDGLSIYPGYYIMNKKIKLPVNVQELISKHFCVLAMTGSGKSWTIGVIVEEIAKLIDIPIIIFDPHGEYSTFILPNEETPNMSISEKISSRVKIFSIADKTTNELLDRQFNKKFQKTGKKRNAERITVNIGELETHHILMLLNEFYELTEAQARFLQAGWISVMEDIKTRETTDIYKIIEKLRSVAGGVAREIAINTLLTKLNLLFKNTPFFRKSAEEKTVKISEIVKKGRISIIDLSGVELIYQQAFVAYLANKILEERIKRNIPPVLIIFEEAHRFSPSGSVKVPSKQAIKKIAQEGRKFLIGMGVVSQRPSRLDSDVLSQCNTQIIMRVTNPIDQNYVKTVSEYITDEDLEQIKSMAPGEAFIFGSSVKISLPIKIRKERYLKHGGYTPDINEELNEYR